MFSALLQSTHNHITQIIKIFFIVYAVFHSTVYAQQQSSSPSHNDLEKNSNNFESIKSIEIQNIEAGTENQSTIDTIDTQSRSLSETYRSALKQHNDLKKYNNQLRELVLSQEKEAESLKSQINRINNLERDVIPLMADMLDTLEQFIELDMPFLVQERQNRIRTLRQLMSNANITNSEKYRRILEAYQIENDYGRAIEAYEGVVNHNGESSQRVTFLKVGRIALMYQTLNGEHSYRWLAEDKMWQPLDSKYNLQLRNGIKMAREQMPPNLLLIPINAPTL